MSWLDSLKSWVGMKRDKAAQSLTADPAGAYRASTYNRQSLANLIVHDLPPFTLSTARIMLESDPLVRFALNVRNAAMSAADIEVKAANPRVKQWVETQWKTLWNKHRGALTAVHRWGFAAIQPLWKECKDGTYDIADVKEFAPEDVRPLAHKGRPVGVRVRRPDVRLLSPRSCWITFDAEAGAFYGNGCLRRMYQPWYYKWMQGGQQKLLQQRMLKDAYIGDIFWYPPDLLVKLPDGTQIPWKDITRELAECRVSGSALNLPMMKDREGNKLVEYTPPQDIGGGSQIFDWGDKLNEDILLGADVAIEVVKASDTGSGFSGRSIPLMVTISACDQELVDIVKAIEIQILRPAAWLIFGGDPEFELTPKPLMESFAKDAGGSPMGGSAMGGQAGQQAPQQAPPQVEPMQFGEDDAIQFGEQLRAPKGGVSIKGVKYAGGEFIPKEVLATLSAADKEKIRSGVYGPQKRAAQGKPASAVAAKPLRDKAKLAKASFKLVDKSIQRYAEEHNEPRFAKAIKGVSFPNGEPIDIAIAGASGVVAHGIELKTMVDNGNNKITMKRDAMERKAKWERKNKAPIHTVVIDDTAVFNANGDGQHDETKRRIFYRRGYGSFRVGTMHEITGGMKELRQIMDMHERSLPDAARRPAGQKIGRLA